MPPAILQPGEKPPSFDAQSCALSGSGSHQTFCGSLPSEGVHCARNSKWSPIQSILRTLLRPLLITAATCAFAAETGPSPLQLRDGRKFDRWRIVGESSDSVTIRYKGGLAKVDKRQLPDALRAQYPYDEQGAKEERATSERLRRERELRQAEQRRRAERALEAERKKTDAAEAAEVVIDASTRKQITAAVKAHAERFFRYEYQPATPGRIISITVDVSAEPPIPWTGWKNRYEVRGRGYLQFYNSHYRSGGFDRSSRDYRAIIELVDGQIEINSFELR